ncbi:unnamed protein product [Brachionus calyciflorus]|uniref:Uncharacterized protein n=1 Tax=Brachionus calyciflorus TaxID=104777 RepID=A0A814QAU5_9BILA|nr:unnamed protein product [Brachionus calyciflorus]
MFFDLVDARIYEIGDIAVKMPMAMEKAVPTSLTIDKDLKKHFTSTFTYDYRKPKESETSKNKLVYKDTFLFYDWLKYKNINLSEPSGEDGIKKFEQEFLDKIKDIFQVLYNLLEEWYNLKLEYLLDESDLLKASAETLPPPNNLDQAPTKVKQHSIEPAQVQNIQSTGVEVYCGGYTSHLISNLTVAPDINEGNKSSICGVPEDTDQQARLGDARLINKVLPKKASEFGTAKNKLNELKKAFNQEIKIELSAELIELIKNINQESIFNSARNIIPNAPEFIILIRQIPEKTESKLGFLKQANCHSFHAMVLKDLGERDEAITQYDLSIKLNKEAWDTYHDKEALLFSMNKFAQARQSN